MNLSETIVPKSDQLNADDLMAGPRTVTIAEVRAGSDEQPVDVILAEFPGRAFRPSKSMRRVMVMAWGPEASTYTGRRLTLYRDPEVMFGKEKVGGIKISHLSHIDRPLSVALTVTRGRRAPYVVQPLPDVHDWSADVAGATTEDELRAIWNESDKSNAVAALIKARRAELNGGAA